MKRAARRLHETARLTPSSAGRRTASAPWVEVLEGALPALDVETGELLEREGKSDGG